MENVVYFTAVWYNLLPFGIVCVHLAYFSRLVCLDLEKSGIPAHVPKHVSVIWNIFSAGISDIVHRILSYRKGMKKNFVVISLLYLKNTYACNPIPKMFWNLPTTNK
jgi:hypothetical protein